MNRPARWPTVWILLCLMTAPLAPVFAAAEYDDPRSLVLELRRLETVVKEGHRQEAHDTLPPTWIVSTPDHRYSIPTGDLKELLTSKDDSATEAWLEHVAQQLEGYAAPVDRTAGDPRAKLDRILSQREFASVRPPSAWERFKERLNKWIGGLLASLFGFLGPSAGTFVWVAGAVAAVFLAWWLYRVIRKDEGGLPTTAAGEQVSTRTWDQWVREAQEALARGDARATAHAAYWAGVARLQEERVLPGNTTLTAREYLRLIPGDWKARGPFAALATGLERFWYANRTASPDELRELLASMEELGCRN